MDAEALDQGQERVLLAGPVTILAHRAARQIVASGGEAIVVASAAEAKGARGAFDRAVFAFDLPDGSGIVLAAEMMLEGRVRHVGFVHPHEDQSTPAHDTSSDPPSDDSPTSVFKP
jgi:hypothetical protein